MVVRPLTVTSIDWNCLMRTYKEEVPGAVPPKDKHTIKGVLDLLDFSFLVISEKCEIPISQLKVIILEEHSDLCMYILKGSLKDWKQTLLDQCHHSDVLTLCLVHLEKTGAKKIFNFRKEKLNARIRVS